VAEVGSRVMDSMLTRSWIESVCRGKSKVEVRKLTDMMVGPEDDSMQFPGVMFLYCGSTVVSNTGCLFERLFLKFVVKGRLRKSRKKVVVIKSVVIETKDVAGWRLPSDCCLSLRGDKPSQR
jgi:hypothetical protein